MLDNNYDLNIWDRIGWETEYEKEGWTISVYGIPTEGSAYGSGEFVVNFDLKPSEAEELTLGLAKSEGGDYTPDHDFWIDVATFFDTYQNIPKRIKHNMKFLMKGGIK